MPENNEQAHHAKAFEAWAERCRDRRSQARQVPYPQGKTSEPSTGGTEGSHSIPMEDDMTICPHCGFHFVYAPHGACPRCKKPVKT